MTDDPAPATSSYDDLAAAFDQVEAFLLGDAPTLTRVDVAARAGVPLELAEELWRLLGFAHRTDEDVAFAESDVHALQMTVDLMRMGILDEESQSALVRTWGRSYARLAEWQVSLLAGLALEGPDPDVRLAELAAGVLPRVEALQAYVWRRHLASAASRLLMNATSGTPEPARAVCFVDIVGYTTHSKTMDEAALVEWIERFEQDTTGTVTDHGGQVIKTIGDEILFTADDLVGAIEVALELTARGADEEDPFPAVRAGLAYGEVVTRLGDVFGHTVNIAARLTSVARPGTLVVDRGAYDGLMGPDGPADRGEDTDDEVEPDGPEGAHDEPDPSPYKLKRLRRVSVKGYSRLEAWHLRRRKPAEDD
ncbi:adenylate/guanylate cyclase domain-containing protein [Nocardioides gansuensis]|uniref:Adenylate/guanylate cyclase domain-containing protein n=1 Tax=Nocardioides gansuensis TaxID=2138300 RepID=A0A2T8F9D6_9ACTN|nr:adenylate/guanylate cyclase domain-containing protein [Nocardioides gansuensis]PVG82299.1 adenylate/guanylate cyclase domain-containing protein [Nocardioides gansuensis]